MICNVRIDLRIERTRHLSDDSVSHERSLTSSIGSLAILHVVKLFGKSCVVLRFTMQEGKRFRIEFRRILQRAADAAVHRGEWGPTMNELVKKIVYVIDPSESRIELAQQIEEAGFQVRPLESAERLFRELERAETASYFTVVSEFELPGINGLRMQHQLKQSPHVATLVFYTHVARVRDVVRAMREGAIAVIEKKDGIGGLLDYIEEAVARSQTDYVRERNCARTMAQLQKLSSGEQEVLRGIMSGKLNKEIAQELSLSIRTIEQRRREVFRKLGVQHPASLARKVMEVAQARDRRRTLLEEESTRWISDGRSVNAIISGFHTRMVDWGQAARVGS